MDLYKKNFTKILGINGQKKAYNRNYLHNPWTSPFQNTVHCDGSLNIIKHC